MSSIIIRDFLVHTGPWGVHPVDLLEISGYITKLAGTLRCHS